MKQVTKNKIKKSKVVKTSKKKGVVVSKKKYKPKNHPQYGTSKLEQDFATNFLDKLNLKYTWQYEAKDIGRFFDYYLDEHHLLIEIDGSYFHSDPRLYEDKDLNRMQKRNKRVDECKNKWALMHGIPLMRIWEKDIRENPEMVMKMLKERLYIQEEKISNQDNKTKKRHTNKIK